MPAKTPEKRVAYEAARKRSEQVLVRLTPDEATRLRRAAEAAGYPLADFVMAMLDDEQPRAILDLAEVAQISAATATLAGAPKAIRDLEADLGRLSGRLAHLFTLNYERASLHRDEIHETLWALQELMRRVLPEIDRMQRLVAPARRTIGLAMREVALKLHAARAVGSSPGPIA